MRTLFAPAMNIINEKTYVSAAFKLTIFDALKRVCGGRARPRVRARDAVDENGRARGLEDPS
jgi:hypothetical protein